MPNKNSLWTLRESPKHGLTSDLLERFRARAAADGVETITVLVRLLRGYIAHGFQDSQAPAAETTTQRTSSDD